MNTEPRQLKTDEEFAKLIPLSTDEEYALLHESIDKHGCIDPIIVWDDCIIDGHTRYRICRLLKQPFNTVSIEFQNREEAKLWILQHQLGKRNVSDAQRIQLALKIKPLIAKQAKANQSAAGGAVPTKISKPMDTRKEIAKMAGVSPAQVSKVENILSKGDADDLARLRSGESSIHSIHNKLLEEKKENPEKKAGVTSITKKQIDCLLRDILVKVEKIATAPEETITACDGQLHNIITKLTELVKRKKEDNMSCTDSQAAC